MGEWEGQGDRPQGSVPVEKGSLTLSTFTAFINIHKIWILGNKKWWVMV